MYSHNFLAQVFHGKMVKQSHSTHTYTRIHFNVKHKHLSPRFSKLNCLIPYTLYKILKKTKNLYFCACTQRIRTSLHELYHVQLFMTARIFQSAALDDSHFWRPAGRWLATEHRCPA